MQFLDTVEALWLAVKTAFSLSWQSTGEAEDVQACKLPSVPDAHFSAGFGFAPDLDVVQSTGDRTAFMIFVDFPDKSASESTEYLRDFFIPSVSEWYTTSSFGQLNLRITADTLRFYRMPNASDSYKYDRGLSAEDHEVYIQDALDAFTSAGGTAPPEPDLLYVVATKNATDISFSPTYMQHVYTRSGKYIAKKAVTVGYDAYATWGYRVLNHETGHTLGLPDYYSFTGSDYHKFVGHWCTMGRINGQSPDYFAWDKWRLGWIADDQVDCVSEPGSTTHDLSPIEVAGGNSRKKMVVVKKSATTALVAEVRSRQGTDEGSSGYGVLLYRVDTDVPTGEGAVVVLNANPDEEDRNGMKFGNAPLNFDGGATTYVSKDLGVTVTVTGQEGADFSFQVVVE